MLGTDQNLSVYHQNHTRAEHTRQIISPSYHQKYKKAEMSKKWQNWSGSVSCYPTNILYPSSEEEIVTLVKECRAKNLKFRVVGSGHSFTPLVKTNNYLVSLEKYSDIEKIDQHKQQVTVRAGMKIKDLGEALFHEGMAQPNLGDIDVQSIGGAISTGTHGSGITFGSISTQVGVKLAKLSPSAG